MTVTLSASHAPPADIQVFVQVQVTIRQQSLYKSRVMALTLASGQSSIELIADTGSGNSGAGTLTLDVSILGGAGYNVGDTPVVGIRVVDPPAATPTPTPGAGPAPPAAPSGFAASAVDHDSIAVSWDSLDGASHYRLEKHLGPFSVVMWEVVAGHRAVSQTSATVDGLTPSTAHQFQVRAYGNGSSYAQAWGSASSSASATTPASQTPVPVAAPPVVLAAPPPPGGFSASAPNYYTVNTRWNAVSGAMCYRFGIWLGNPGGWKFEYLPPPTTNHTRTAGIARGTRYDVRVAASYAACPPPHTAEWSLDNWANVTTPRPTPPAPGGFSASATGTRSIRASWNRVTGANNYEFQINAGGWKTHTTTSTSITVSSGLSPGTTYSIRVRAHGDGSWLAAVWGPRSTGSVTTTSPAPTPIPLPNPPAPTVSSTSATTSTISVSWNVSGGGVSKYRFGIYTDAWRDQETTSTSGTKTGLNPGTRYDLRLQAYGDGATYATKWSAYRWFKVTTLTPTPTSTPTPTPTPTPSLSLPPAPSNVSASINVGTGARSYGVELLWALMPGAASFKVERSDDNGVTWPQPGDSGYDGHVTTGITGTQHSVTGLVCDNDYVFRISALGNGSRYQAAYGPTTLVTRYTPITGQSARGAAGGDFPCAKPSISVIPLSVDAPLGRKVKIEWKFRTGSTYFLEYRPIQKDGTEVGWNNLISGGTPYESIDFDIDRSPVGFVDAKEGVGFRVKASLGGQETPYAEIILIDTPILRAEVESPGQVSLSWTDIDNVLGGKGLYTVGAYSARVRRFGESFSNVSHINRNVPHTSRYWYPTQFVDSKVVPVDATAKTISGLAANEVYAIQLIALVTKGESTIPTTVFSVRDAYVWASHRSVTDRERVASFPLKARLSKDAQGKFTYAYHICKDTFTFTGKWSDWEKLIVHAMGQWQLATDNLITMRYLKDVSCASYGDVFTDVADFMRDSGHTPDADLVRTFVTGLSYYGNFTEQDKDKNEIILVDAGTLLFNEDLQSAATFPELADEIGLSLCVFTGAFGCVIFGDDTQDILLNNEKFTTDALAIPGGAGSNPEPPERGDAPFNRCASEKEEDNAAYLTVVHEGGHAIGIGDAKDRDPDDPRESYHNTHPNTNLLNSIVNSRDMAGCTPNPLDIMAIFAIYQAK